MKVASIQVEIKDGETKEERIIRVGQKLDELEGYDLIILPEIWATGYFSFDNYIKEAETINGSFVQFFSEKARKLGAYVHAGSFVEKEGSKYYNTSVLFNREGKLIGKSRKIHLFRYGSAEGEILTPGEKPIVVQTEFGKVGLSTCYDLRFPELYRSQVDQGAKIFLVTSAWPHQRLEHWKILNVVRALENQCFLISSNCVGTTRNVLMGGHSQVVDPWGTVIASAGEFETIVKTEINLDQIDYIREMFPQLKHRVL
ncbi:carbon-nitrogen family hydrolase [Saccharococcus caldoxylosilyticus]|uniref:Putative hydrolase n=1 Tax=Parageobacillus caldoxylosilyticus NBRC 107762 TaxID=1220594 RepID=A0A023DJS3_9BACL|nr:carbon-nitrogen family hydrolase [Parageobacillus caldoxylosilyticus]MBB3853251.1 putative amidohydrolase [Parageobacillus caldoxylosilyticus]QXJ37113.1 2-oxoglutaramate amidase [Parageobacillus caldoxylosilyticus]GAJ41520.1 putative hydrolase [Parageobacillus caldoxylosilyticus NBRC 107762]